MLVVDARKTYATIVSLQRHEQAAHSTERSFVCKRCDMAFPDAVQLRMHEVNHKSVEFPCDLCNRMYSRKDSLQFHVKVFHNGKRYKCDQCDRSFAYHPSLIAHKVLHTGIPQIRKYVCGYCPKTFVYSWHLKVHIRTHTGERPYACDQCDKTYRHSWLLANHKLTHQADHRFVCSQCDKIFADQKRLQIHEEAHRSRRFSCDVCCRSYAHQTSLSFHKKSHTGGIHRRKKNQNKAARKASDSSTCKIRTSPTVGNAKSSSSDQKFSQLKTCVPSPLPGGYEITQTSAQNDVRELQDIVALAEINEPSTSPRIPSDKAYQMRSNEPNNSSCVEQETCMAVEVVMENESNQNQSMAINRLDCQVLLSDANEDIQQSFGVRTEQDSRTSDVEEVLCIDTPFTGMRRRYRYACRFCKKTYSNKSYLRGHETTHRGEHPYACKYCGKKYMHKNSKELHEFTRSCKLEGPFTCSLCRKMFSLKTTLHLHKLAFHSATDKKFNCDKCDAAYGLRCDLIKHQLLHGPTGKHQCETCGKIFSFASSLNVHLRIHTGERPCVCDHCGKAFSKITHLSRHKLSYHTKRSLTGNTASDSSSTHLGSPQLLANENSHATGISMEEIDLHELKGVTKHYRYACRFCEKTYSSKRYLRGHEATQHPFACKHCDKKFMNQNSKDLHELTHSCNNEANAALDSTQTQHSSPQVQTNENSHPNEILIRDMNFPKDERMTKRYPYACRFCKKTYSQKKYLRVHEGTHGGEYPYACEHCGKKFMHKNSKELHELTHSSNSDGPFACHLCRQSFTANRSLSLHIKEFHSAHFKTFKCNKCYKSYAHRRSLIAHKAFHRVLPPTDEHVCSTCGKIFSHFAQLKAHVQTHTGERRYACNDCDWAFKTKARLIRHRLSFHTKQPYTRKASLDSSSMKIGDQMVPANKRKQNQKRKVTKKCLTNEEQEQLSSVTLDEVQSKAQSGPHSELSKAKGVQGGEIDSQIFIPSDDDIHTCDCCGQYFTAKTSLQRHIGQCKRQVKAHTRQSCPNKQSVHQSNCLASAMLACDQCDETFKSSWSLTRHKLSHVSEFLEPLYWSSPMGNGQSLHFSPGEETLNGDVTESFDQFTATEDEERLSTTEAPKPFGDAEVPVLTQLDTKAILDLNTGIQITIQESDILTACNDEDVKDEIFEEIDQEASYTAKQNENSLVESHAPCGEKVENLYMCSCCGKTFTEIKFLHEHGTTDSDETKYACDDCDKEFLRQSSLEFPVRAHSDVGQRELACELCDEVFSQLDTLKVHMEVFHNCKRFKCDQCDKSFIQRSSLIAHKLIHKETSPPGHNLCSYCGENFKSSLQLNTHLRMHIGERPNECDQHRDYSSDLLGHELNRDIAYSFTYEDNSLWKPSQTPSRNTSLTANDEPVQDRYKSKLNELISATDKESADLTAPTADEQDINATESTVADEDMQSGSDNHQSAVQLSELGSQATVLSESVEKDVCMRTRQGTLLHRLNRPCSFRQSEPPFGEGIKKRYVSSYCGIGYTKSKAWRRHEATHTGEQPVACEHCDKEFWCKAKLESHQLTHSQNADLRFSCNLCGATFAQKLSLLQHRELLHNGKRYKCDQCDKIFKYNSELYLHRKCTHRNAPRFWKYMFDFCGKQFFCANHYKVHLRMHTGERPFACDQCDKRFGQTSALARHKQAHHSNLQFICNQCGESFDKAIKLQRHEKYHGDNRYACDECFTSYVSKSSLRYHKRQYHRDKITGANAKRDETRLFPREIKIPPEPHNKPDTSMSEKFANRIRSENLALMPANSTSHRIFSEKVSTDFHLDSSLNQGESLSPSATVSEQVMQPSFTERIMKFDDNEYLEGDDSLRAVEQENSTSVRVESECSLKENNSSRSVRKTKGHACKNCDAIYTSVTDLHQHEATHTGEQAYSCEHCHKTFTHRKSLLSHELTHCRNDDGRFACDLCSRTFLRGYDLKLHREIFHHGKRLACDQCDKTYADRSSLIDHEVRHHGRPAAAQHICNHCGKEFLKSSHFHRHVRSHSRERPYVCEHCGKTFGYMSSVARHKLTHIVERPFTCKHCDRTFNLLTKLQRHERVHRGRKQFSCSRCHISYHSRKSLLAHQKRYGQSRNTRGKATLEDKATIAKSLISATETAELSSLVPVEKVRRRHELQPSRKPSFSSSERISCETEALRSKVAFTSDNAIQAGIGNRPSGTSNIDNAQTVVSNLIQGSSNLIELNLPSTIDDAAEPTDDEPVKKAAGNKTEGSFQKLNASRPKNIKNKFACGYCEKTFAKANHQRVHEAIHTGNRPFACVHCDKRFIQNFSLKLHQRIHNSNEQSFACGNCNKTFFRKQSLCLHMEVIHHGKRFQCNQCDKSYAQRAALIAHKLLHSGIPMIARHVCDQCSKTFGTLAHLNVHLRSHTGELPYACTQCDAKFRHSFHLTKHKQVHLLENPFVCSQCNWIFSGLSQLKRHKKFHTERSFRCNHCSRLYFDEAALQRHERQFHGGSLMVNAEMVQDQSVVAALRTPISVPKKFVDASASNVRAIFCVDDRVNNGSEEFACGTCAKRFPSLLRLRRHRCSLAEKPELISSPCESLSLYSTDEVADGVAHKGNQHGGSQPSPRFVSEFVALQRLRVAEQKHLDEHSWLLVCDECDNVFTEASQLRKHQSRARCAVVSRL